MPVRSPKAFLRRYPLISFFVLAYALTWLLWAPMVFAGVPAFSETRHVPSPAGLPGVAIALGVALLAAVVMTVATRRRLSYPRYRYEAEHLDLGGLPAAR